MGSAKDLMPITREQLHHLVERLPEQEMAEAERLLLFLSRETISEEFGRAILTGWDQAGTGKTVVCLDYNNMVERVLGD
jgi:hypothetical protein